MIGVESFTMPIRYVMEGGGVKLDIILNSIEFLGATLVERNCIFDNPPLPPTNV